MTLLLDAPAANNRSLALVVVTAPLLMAAAVPMADAVTSTGFTLFRPEYSCRYTIPNERDRGAEGCGDGVRAAGDVLGVEDLRAPVAAPGDARSRSRVGVESAVGQRDGTGVVPDDVGGDQVPRSVRTGERLRVRRATLNLIRLRLHERRTTALPTRVRDGDAHWWGGGCRVRLQVSVARAVRVCGRS